MRGGLIRDTVITGRLLSFGSIRSGAHTLLHRSAVGGSISGHKDPLAVGQSRDEGTYSHAPTDSSDPSGWKVNVA